MSRHLRCFALARVVTVALALMVSAPVFATTYHVDCQAGSGNGVLGSLAQVNQLALQPGDAVLFHRGTLCRGTLAPKGSGTAAAPIMLGAYGTGALPVLDGNGHTETVRLFNQRHWNVAQLEVTGSSVYGVHVTGDSGLLQGIHLSSLRVHGIHGVIRDKDSGAVVVSTGSPQQTFDDVVIDGVDAYDVTQWAGIFVNALNSGFGANAPRNTHVEIRNSTVHDVYGDGIIIYGALDAAIRHSVDYRTGTQPKENVGTPNGIWTFECERCVVEFNEGYQTTSPGVDGGVYDLDYLSKQSTVQYNYGHDADGYCVGIFASQGLQIDSTVRYNVCINNGRKKEIAFQGDLYLVSFDGGTFQGVDIHNNTSIWRPVTAAPALVDFGTYNGTASFRNNLIVAPQGDFTNTSSSFVQDNNLYWNLARKGSRWIYGGTTYNAFADYQKVQDAHGLFTDPKLRQALPVTPVGVIPRPDSPVLGTGQPIAGDTRDFFGFPVTRPPAIGAVQVSLPVAYDLGPATPQPVSPEEGNRLAAALAPAVSACGGRPMLAALVQLGTGTGLRAAHADAVGLKSVATQHPDLCTAVVNATGGLTSDMLANLHEDWSLGSTMLLNASGSPGCVDRGTIVLLDADGKFVEGWTGTVPPALLGPELARYLAP